MIHTTRFSSLLFSLAGLLAFASAVSAAEEKIEFPAASQHAVVQQRVGLTDISIDYSRPNKNGRAIFGDLVPNGELWRTGANAPTKIKFSEAVKLEGKEIPAGEYALFTIPNANEWTVIISKDAAVANTAAYKQENDAARLTVKPSALPEAVETFTIGLADVNGAAATLHLDWDKTRIPVKLTTDDFEKLSKQLDAAAKGSTPLDNRTAYQAAVFYLDNNKDLEQALKWINQAVAKSPDAYNMHMRRAQIELKMGNKKEATASAQKALEILKAAKVQDQTQIHTAEQIIEHAK
ncbi:MAG: DUF2911 domain-containing protein [Chthoniobacterales bacterium]